MDDRDADGAPRGQTAPALSDHQVQAGASAARRTIAVLGDIWTLRILRTIFRGKRRYGDFVTVLGVSRAVLTDRLGKLMENGVLLRHAPDGGHPQYRLSESGLDLWSLFLAIWLWEHDWGAAKDPLTWAPDLPRATMLHVDCGQVMRPQLRCMHCQVALIPQQTAMLPASSPPADVPRPVAALQPATASAFRRARAASRASTGAGSNSPRLVRVIGDRWNSAVVGAAFRGTRTFSRFERELEIGPAQLSERLVELQELGILRADVYAGTRHEYRLTHAGLALFPITFELMRWGNQWLLPPEQALRLRHLPCGEPLDARWHCGHCQQVLTRQAIRFT